MNSKSFFSSALLVIGLLLLTPALAQAQDSTAWQDTTDTMYQDTTDTLYEDTTETQTTWEDTTGTAQLWKEDNASNGALLETLSARADVATSEVKGTPSLIMVANRNHAGQYQDVTPVLSSAPR